MVEMVEMVEMGGGAGASGTVRIRGINAERRKIHHTAERCDEGKRSITRTRTRTTTRTIRGLA
jgi:hypothetical protein